jgi:hypothetical protein
MNKSMFMLIMLGVLAVSTVHAGMSPTYLPTSSYYEGWHSFSENVNGESLTGRVEFAVYRGTEADDAISTTGYAGEADYVYAYQVFVDQQSDAALTYFAVTGVDPTAVDSDGIGTMEDFAATGIEPGDYGFNADQTKGIWEFNNATIIQGEHSWFLFIYSNYDWTAGDIQVQSVYDDDIPVPEGGNDNVPEPMTLVLLAGGALLTLRRRS